MKINFIPLRERMKEEIEACILLSRLETLLTFCNCCIYKLYEGSTNSECSMCRIHQAANRIAKRSSREPVEGEELLGVC